MEYFYREKQTNAIIAPNSYNPLNCVLKIANSPCLVAYVNWSIL